MGLKIKIIEPFNPITNIKNVKIKKKLNLRIEINS